jgi:Ni/Co efflux regulator RcnB
MARIAFHNQKESTMKSKVIVSAILAMSMVTGELAFAQGYGDRNDRGRNEQAQRGGQQDRRDNEGRPPNRPQDRDRGRHNDERRDERGAGPNHDFHRGQRLPAEYRHRQYVVDDWRGHHLSAPPRGYHWVQTGGDYVLVAIASGIILQLLLNN